MKEYRLKKWYPSLPKDWEEGMIVGYGDRQINLSPCNGKYTNRHIDALEAINHPEFWEEVVKIDYELISYQDIKGNVYRDRECVGSILGDGELYIFCVMRLSDNESFSEGDMVYRKGFTEIPFKIDKIILDDEGNIRFQQGKKNEDIHCDVLMKNVDRIQQSLFVTFDGVAKGDTVWCLHRFDDGSLSGSICEIPVLKYPFDKSVPVFSSFSSAEKYLKDNKKQFSLNDIKEVVKKLDCFGSTLIEYLESKL
jgi:hypothetical protein